MTNNTLQIIVVFTLKSRAEKTAVLMKVKWNGLALEKTTLNDQAERLTVIQLQQMQAGSTWIWSAMLFVLSLLLRNFKT